MMACSKDPNSNKIGNQPNTINGTVLNADHPLRHCNVSVEDLVLFPEDLDEERMYCAKYALAFALKDELIKDNIQDYIFNNYEDNPEVIFKIDDLISQFPYLEDVINTTLIDGIDGLSTQFTSYADLKTKLELRGYIYGPSLTISNFATCSKDAQALVSPGIELLEDAEYGDEITGFLGGVNVQLGEEEAKVDQQVGVFAITYYVIQTPPIVTNPIGQQSSGTSIQYFKTAAVGDLNVTTMKIAKRYEKSKHSEVTAQALRWRAQNTWASGSYIYPNGSGQSSYCELASIHKNSVNSNINNAIWNSVGKFVARGFPNSDVKYFFNLYERDWWEPSMSLGSFNYNPGYNGTQINSYGNMTFGDNWYLYDPQTIANNNGWFTSFIWEKADNDACVANGGTEFLVYSKLNFWVKVQ